jgi:SAM-dependent methyltransferase
MTKCAASEIYKGRYPYLEYRKWVWKEIVNFVQKDAGEIDFLIELGAGYCDFINHFRADRKIGYDVNPEMKKYASGEVELRIEDATQLARIADDSVDLIFASNFLEHLNITQHRILMPRIYTVLKKQGRLILIQPNYHFCRHRYFDDDTHQTIFSHKSIQEFLNGFDFTVIKLIPNLLPFSMNTTLPKGVILTRFLVKMYLMSPIKPLGAQMYVIAEKS